MSNEPDFWTSLVDALKTSGVSRLETIANQIQDHTAFEDTLALRAKWLDKTNVECIMNAFKNYKGQIPVKTLSFSYNKEIGDEGSIIIAQSLPKSIVSLGLVSCGITDIGGEAIFSWIKNATQLKMICIENNNFSAELKKKYSDFAKRNPMILVVT
ncbi:hypothetical protein H2O64_06015 [Kordia sp. YSTF-M3]|uniref:Leucine-rich repeat domain-containing protein n=1 Tax=Kordia aestuariivivens TaxID=2759037 RepID=A0ABR7Q7B6_9FLAO|nr:hypothetical protein [Kordia aestuariivivens]MBC8754219.1 hypothetical protein [Kordia aestuariivivens]